MVKLSEKIALEMRDRIVTGKLPPGSRFPNREELCKEFDVSPLVVNHAVRILVKENFVGVGARKLGTWVSQNPPHLHRYKLIFEGAPKTRSLFLNSLQKESERITASTHRTVECFFGLNGYQDVAKIQELLEDLRKHRIAGLAFGASPGPISSFMFKGDNLPRVGIGQKMEFNNVPLVELSMEDFCKAAVAELRKRGCRKIGFIAPAFWRSDRLWEHMCDSLSSAGLEYCQERIYFAAMWEEAALIHGMKLFLHPGLDSVPDGLIIGDDNLIAGADAALQALGVQDLPIVAHGNYPYLSRTVTPMTRIVFDMPATLEVVLDTIDQLRLGMTVEQEQKMPTRLLTAAEVEAMDPQKDPAIAFALPR